MAVVFTLGLLMASWLGAIVLAGILFVLGCALAAWFTRPPDLLIVVLTPPILFSGALIFVQAVTASGSVFLSVAAGSVVVVASLAPWLAVGLIGTVAIALPRGLVGCIGDLIRDLRADAARRKRARAARQPGTSSLGWHLLARPARAEQVRPGGPRRPGDARAAGPLSRGPGTVKAARPVSGNPGSPKAGSASSGPSRTKVPGSASRGPSSTKATGPVSPGPASTKATGPVSPAPATAKAAGPAPRSPATAMPPGPASRGPASTKGPTPGQGTRHAAPKAPGSADGLADAR
jgi:hypothetical protein